MGWWGAGGGMQSHCAFLVQLQMGGLQALRLECYQRSGALVAAGSSAPGRLQGVAEVPARVCRLGWCGCSRAGCCGQREVQGRGQAAGRLPLGARSCQARWSTVRPLCISRRSFWSRNECPAAMLLQVFGYLGVYISLLYLRYR